jgi:hypothetical protein
VSLPPGGGAIRGIGEKFAANSVTGPVSLTVPSPGRSGFGPQLALSYDPGAGNGPFGWSLSLPTITRKIDKDLPRHQDASESDAFVLSGAEDLVPVLRDRPDLWHRLTSTDAAVLTIGPDDLHYSTRSRAVSIKSMRVLARVAGAPASTATSVDGAPVKTNPPTEAELAGLLSSSVSSAMALNTPIAQTVPQPNTTEDMALIINYSIA